MGWDTHLYYNRPSKPPSSLDSTTENPFALPPSFTRRETQPLPQDTTPSVLFAFSVYRQAAFSPGSPVPIAKGKNFRCALVLHVLDALHLGSGLTFLDLTSHRCLHLFYFLSAIFSFHSTSWHLYLQWLCHPLQQCPPRHKCLWRRGWRDSSLGRSSTHRHRRLSLFSHSVCHRVLPNPWSKSLSSPRLLSFDQSHLA